MRPHVLTTLHYLRVLLAPEGWEELLGFAVLERAILDATARPARKRQYDLFIAEEAREEARGWLQEGEWVGWVGWGRVGRGEIEEVLRKGIPEVYDKREEVEDGSSENREKNGGHNY